MVEEPPNPLCDAFEAAILDLRREIGQKGERVDTVQNLLQALKDQANPDQVLIEKGMAFLQRLEDRLQLDLAQLKAFEQDFAALCRPPSDSQT
jgi:hypothetical protein